MGLSFKSVMNALLSAIIFFKGNNFTVLKEYDIIPDRVHVKEYRYNMGRFLTDVWPPNVFGGGSGLPIKSAVREKDGSDVTEMVLKFAGPKKNYVNPVSVFYKRKRFRVDFQNFGRIRFVIEDAWEPYNGNVVVTDILGFKKVIRVEYSSSHDGPGARVSS